MLRALDEAREDVEAGLCGGCVIVLAARSTTGERSRFSTRSLYGGLNGLERVGALATALANATAPV
jgi:hypothetical protein